MVRKIFLAGLIIVSVCGVSGLAASASTTKPTIKSVSPTSATVGTDVTIIGTNLAGATVVTFNGKAATVISDSASKINADVPGEATTGYIEVKTPGGMAKSTSKFKVLKPLGEVMSAVNDNGYNSCAVLASSKVDCWGDGSSGDLGNGIFYPSPPGGSAKPVAVEGVGGSGTLSGVENVVTDDHSGNGSYCALLTSGQVDCWGYGELGELGNGEFYQNKPFGSAKPVAVEGVGGVGTLTGVTSLFGDSGGETYCALVASGGVDCWGSGQAGEIGNGTFTNSATPVEVEGVGGIGTLSGVENLVGDADGYCALLGAGGVDCWGSSTFGQLGDGTFTHSDTPVAVEGIGGSGTLAGVSYLAGSGNSYCAVDNTGLVSCWGYGYNGELGNGTFYTTGKEGSDTPVAVDGVGGSGTLSGVSSLSGGFEGFCALLTSSGVSCWGFGASGDLGDGMFYTTGNEGSATPVTVDGVGGMGTLSDATSLLGGTEGFCAVITSGGVDCWGYGADGNLGDGTFYKTGNKGSATPVAVDGVGGSGALSGVTNLVGRYCAVITSSGVDCWGYGRLGQVGDGSFTNSDTPVEVG